MEEVTGSSLCCIIAPQSGSYNAAAKLLSVMEPSVNSSFDFCRALLRSYRLCCLIAATGMSLLFMIPEMWILVSEAARSQRGILVNDDPDCGTNSAMSPIANSKIFEAMVSMLCSVPVVDF